MRDAGTSVPKRKRFFGPSILDYFSPNAGNNRARSMPCCCLRDKFLKARFVYEGLSFFCLVNGPLSGVLERGGPGSQGSEQGLSS
jgi:hypothetical protein